MPHTGKGFAMLSADLCGVFPPFLCMCAAAKIAEGSFNMCSCSQKRSGNAHVQN